jgi:hypothetical protein
MRAITLRGALAGAVVLLGGLAAADEPVLPAPRPLVREIVGPVGFTRPDPYAVWQYYAVDRQGRFRPLVLPSYDVYRYAANGEPYPGAQSHPKYFTPMMGNPATFAGPTPSRPLMFMDAVPFVAPAPAPAVTGWERMPYAEK